eukprot:scaffold143999_cov34-Prasinocladus_malaysianus.AAC.1
MIAPNSKNCASSREPLMWASPKCNRNNHVASRMSVLETPSEQCTLNTITTSLLQEEQADGDSTH